MSISNKCVQHTIWLVNSYKKWTIDFIYFPFYDIAISIRNSHFVGSFTLALYRCALWNWMHSSLSPFFFGSSVFFFPFFFFYLLAWPTKHCSMLTLRIEIYLNGNHSGKYCLLLYSTMHEMTTTIMDNHNAYKHLPHTAYTLDKKRRKTQTETPNPFRKCNRSWFYDLFITNG